MFESKMIEKLGLPAKDRTCCPRSCRSRPGENFIEYTLGQQGCRGDGDGDSLRESVEGEVVALTFKGIDDAGFGGYAFTDQLLYNLKWWIDHGLLHHGAYGIVNVAASSLLNSRRVRAPVRA